MNRIASIAAFCLFVVGLAGRLAGEPPQRDPPADASPSTKWKTLSGSWQPCQFGGDGEVTIGDDVIDLQIGDPLTGIRWTGEVPRENYEIRLLARRTEGFDFFCGLTFPIGESHASFILGGWSGSVVGLSNIDDMDASQNETTMFQTFKNDEWTKVQVRVTGEKVHGWIDDALAFEVERADRKFDIRIEVDPCLPLGIAAFQSRAELKNIQLRRFKPGSPRATSDTP